MSKIYYELDLETGELQPANSRIIALEDGDVVRRKKQIEHATITYHAKNNNGNFVWLLFNYGKDLFPNVSAANITRLMYAATFCHDDGSIMSKSTLRDQMKLNRARWSEFWNEMTENNILYEQDGLVYISAEYVTKGTIDTNKNYTRLFCEYVQQLYESCDSAGDHKQLSYIFKIIPFINRRTNTVCMNPMEQDERSIQPMRLGDFCEAIGYERKNARRLASELLKIRINGELAVGFFVSSMDENTWLLVANPKLYFGGKYDPIFQKYRALFIEEAKNHETNLLTNGQNMV